MITIDSSVGATGKNRPVDVMIIQHLLNLNAASGNTVAGPVNGVFDTALGASIKGFQASVMKSKVPDGRIDPGGKSLRTLATPVKSSTTVKVLRSVVSAARPGSSGTRAGEASSSLGMIDPVFFCDAFDRQFGKLGASARAGMEELLTFINNDYEIVDVGGAAYMLATVMRECAGRWKPIREFGRGAGKDYGAEIAVKDKAGVTHKNVYYGRGYVQLTWKANYAALGEALGYDDELVIDPDKVLDSTIAYEIMSHGMRNGSFSTAKHKLSDYINSSACDYYHARRIINLMDAATEIATNATNLELLLRVSCG